MTVAGKNLIRPIYDFLFVINLFHCLLWAGIEDLGSWLAFVSNELMAKSKSRNETNHLKLTPHLPDRFVKDATIVKYGMGQQLQVYFTKFSIFLQANYKCSNVVGFDSITMPGRKFLQENVSLQVCKSSSNGTVWQQFPSFVACTIF